MLQVHVAGQLTGFHCATVRRGARCGPGELRGRTLPPGGAGATLHDMSDAIRRRREQRREFLRRLYDVVDGSVSEFINAWELGATIELDESEALKICEYLAEKGLIMIDDHRAGIVRMTAAGVDAVEAEA
jgi:hypothetical protein